MSCTSVLVCKQELRRSQVRQKVELNGLDYLEVDEGQLVLTVYFLGKAPPSLEKENIRIEGGRRITHIQVTGLEIHREEDPETDDCVHISVDKSGDFSTYCLCLIEIDAQTKKPIVDIDKECKKHFRPMHGFDPRYACLEFSFKAGCQSDLDCKPQAICPPEQRDEPEINYLAKDYASFRQLILDRLELIMPDWKERHVPDLGITLVELLAYVGDHLSYYQDAVATEAYLDTARRRISVRRHVRLVDYQLHEGCNARTWVTFRVTEDCPLKPVDFYLITDPGIPNYANVLAKSQLPDISPKPYLIFEALVEDADNEITLYSDHNEITIYTWGDTQCCLPKGSTSATLLDPGKATQPVPDPPGECGPAGGGDPKPGGNPVPAPPDSDYRLKLKPCDIIIFEEVKGAKTGNSADADPSHRHAVRLTKADKSQDPLTNDLIWEIEWTVEDALPFSLCISSIKKEDCSLIANVSVVRGNVLLVDHGKSVIDMLEPVPLDTLLAECGDGCMPREATQIAGCFEPQLPKPDVTFSQALLPCEQKIHACSYAAKLTPASALLKQNPRLALPEVKLHEARMVLDKLVVADKPIWEPCLDLLDSEPEDCHFVVEMEDDRRAKLRFGNGESGRFPDAGTLFQAQYRIGSGTIGNVGAESITHIVFSNNLPNGIDIVPRNPLPAIGGTNPEPIAEAKLFAPDAFRKELQRAITADDYARIVMRDFSSQVQRAAAKLLWNGSWFEVLVVIDPLGTEDTDEELLCEIRHRLCRYHRIGHDVVVVQASYVALEIEMTVCVLPHYLRGHVKSALLEVFSNGMRPDGSKGFFHPDNLSFGEGVYLSKLVAAAQAVEGVESVVVTTLKRFLAEPNQEIQNGLLPLGPFEVARLDNDPGFPENGKFTLDMRGGR
ncbi:MAG: putative baseplate assembly protein [Methylobacter sp.]